MIHLQVNVLLQAYISHLKLEGFALMSDMVYVTQVTNTIIIIIMSLMVQLHCGIYTVCANILAIFAFRLLSPQVG